MKNRQRTQRADCTFQEQDGSNPRSAYATDRGEPGVFWFRVWFRLGIRLGLGLE